jgi:2-phosphosulfolactate phosphatase
MVVVDVLSFTTAVVIAAARGTELFPCAGAREGRELARVTGSELAVGRHELDAIHPWSLSPASIVSARSVERLVLPSPNGSAISALVAVIGSTRGAARHRNVTAVVTWLIDHRYGSAFAPVGVIAAGEQWPDGSLRPAIEDLFAAGLVLAGLGGHGTALTPEATVAARSVAGLTPTRVADLVRASTSGTELRVADYGEDVELAVEVDADTTVPVMAAGSQSFRDRVPAARR